MRALDELHVPKPAEIRAEIARLRGEIAQLKELLRLAEVRHVALLGEPRRRGRRRP
jgi:hypothetical protein